MKRRAMLLLLLIPVLASAQTPLEVARDYRGRHEARILQDFASLLSIPNVTSDTVGIRRNAVHIQDEFRARGADMFLLELPGANPIVFGRLDTPGAKRTLGIYVHYDGQPVDEDKWTTGPWTPTLFSGSMETGGVRLEFPDPGETVDPEWRLYARSSGDDKAPIPALLAAMDAFLEAGIPLTSNLIFLFEGEEEAGSDHLGEFLDRHLDKLEVDAWLICDGPVHQSRRPQLVFGVRGVTGFEITVYGASRNLHSGHYGNWAPNPALMLSRLLAGMKDENGNVLIKGFYDSVEPLGNAEREALATIPDQDRELMKELGMAASEGNDTLSRRLLLPSLNIRGLASANVGTRARNVIPSTATAAIDIRLVRGNQPDVMLDLVEDHIRSRGYHVVREDPDPDTRRQYPRLAKIVRGGGYGATRTRMDHPFVRDLTAAAEAAAGEPVILMPSLGGSLPLYLFTERWNVPLVVVPVANHDDNQHAADENIRLANLWYGIDLMASILTMP